MAKGSLLEFMIIWSTTTNRLYETTNGLYSDHTKMYFQWLNLYCNNVTLLLPYYLNVKDYAFLGFYNIEKDVSCDHYTYYKL